MISFVVVGRAFTCLPPLVTIIDKELFTGRDIFYCMENDQVPIRIVPVFDIVIVGVVKQASPAQNKDITRRRYFAVFVLAEHIVVKDTAAFVCLDAKKGTLFNGGVRGDLVRGEDATAKGAGGNNDIGVLIQFFLHHLAIKVELRAAVTV